MLEWCSSNAREGLVHFLFLFVGFLAAPMHRIVNLLQFFVQEHQAQPSQVEVRDDVLFLYALEDGVLNRDKVLRGHPAIVLFLFLFIDLPLDLLKDLNLTAALFVQ